LAADIPSSGPFPQCSSRTMQSTSDTSFHKLAIRHRVQIDDWIFGCLPLLTTDNYNTFTSFHNLQMTTAHFKSLQSAVCSHTHCLATASSNGYVENSEVIG
jgi:hypothetical protein